MSESQGVTGDGIVEFAKSVRPRGMGKSSIRWHPTICTQCTNGIGLLNLSLWKNDM
ncbi:MULTISPECIES: hypothetical protein [unclassified Bacillus (in: firmicutes)]|uniref:hypothetical protein n=1 Tax=unclassified Bacillus (in: firmicutes) TaxID=185979 RepID=UPI003010028F